MRMLKLQISCQRPRSETFLKKQKKRKKSKHAPHPEPLPVFGPEKRPLEDNIDSATVSPAPPAKKGRSIRRPCGLCPQQPDATRLAIFCYNCNIAVCKDHRHTICDSCTKKI